LEVRSDRERWRRLRDLFESAGGLGPSAQEAFVDRECRGDPELRQELLDMLRLGGEEEDPLGAAIRSAAREAADVESSRPVTVGQSIGKYQIAGTLGQGGMGAVYIAEDPELDRRIALKLLPAWALPDARAIERFHRETKALAALNHPNIVSIYSIERAGEHLFFTMELVDGQPLAEAIPAGGMPLEQFFEVAIPAAEAVAAAQSHGVTHRDLKPANIMLTRDGTAKILDFGLAKLHHAEESAGTSPTSPEITRVGVVMGTVPYMSPEHVEGRPVDARSDLFSLGIILYEMLTGSRPFLGDSTSSVMSAIRAHDPPSVSALRAGLPPRLVQIIRRCLEKAPEQRYQRAEDLAQELIAVRAAIRRHPKLSSGISGVVGLLPALRRSRLALPAAAVVLGLVLVIVALRPGPLRAPSAGATSEPPIVSLAVLPFANLSRDADQQYLADGMTELLITELSKIGSLRVISRTSVMSFGKTDKPVPEIARELGGVDAIIEGSVARDGDRLRLTAQLVHAESDQHIWAESYERDLTDLFALQAELTRSIADRVSAQLTPGERSLLARNETTDTAASEAYLRGLEAMTPDDRRRALGHFQDAVKADPEFALAHFQIANIHYLLGATGYAMPREVTGKASAALSRALEIDPDLPEGHFLEALITYTFEWDWALAERKLQRALELMPGSVGAHLAIGRLMIDLGRFEEGLTALRRAQEIDPLSHISLVPASGHRSHRVLALNLYRARRFDEALAMLSEQPESLGPGDFWVLSRIAHAQGDHATCISYDLAWRRLVGHPKPLLEELEAAREEGKPEFYWRTLAESFARYPKGLEPAHLFIDVYARLGETELALDWLEEAYGQRRPDLTSLGVDPLWDSLRSHPRFRDLLVRLNLPQEASTDLGAEGMGG
jgi:serine/threonine-protein kinase